MLRLFYSPGSCARASHIALEEAGADFEPVLLDLKSGAQKTPEYLAINPKARVPALQTDRGILTENPAILTYIARAYPEKALAPLDDVFAFAEMQAFNAYLSSTVHVAMAMQYRASRFTDVLTIQKDLAANARNVSVDKFHLIEARLSDGRPFVMGDTYTVADSYLVVFSGWLKTRDYAADSEFPHVADHRIRVLDRPTSRKVIALEGL